MATTCLPSTQPILRPYPKQTPGRSAVTGSQYQKPCSESLPVKRHASFGGITSMLHHGCMPIGWFLRADEILKDLSVGFLINGYGPD